MTVVPENATLCGCWVRAPRWVQEAERFIRTFPLAHPKGMRSCERCHGQGWYVGKPFRGMGLRS